MREVLRAYYGEGTHPPEVRPLGEEVRTAMGSDPQDEAGPR
jgi:hypothetical protein